MLKCIAIDDEPIALEILRKYCERHGGMALECFSSPLAGMQRVATEPPDILFLDIELNSNTSGIELARRIPQSCCLIFTTAYANYALEGFEVDAVDFLHKPFFYERFDAAVQKAEKRLRSRDLMRAAEAAERQIILKSEYKNVAIPVSAICYIESIDNYVRVHLSDGTSVLSKIPLSRIITMLPEDEFVRIHRSFVVARCRIARFTRTQVYLSGISRPIPIGKTYTLAP